MSDTPWYRPGKAMTNSILRARGEKPEDDEEEEKKKKPEPPKLSLGEEISASMVRAKELFDKKEEDEEDPKKKKPSTFGKILNMIGG